MSNGGSAWNVSVLPSLLWTFRKCLIALYRICRVCASSVWTPIADLHLSIAYVNDPTTSSARDSHIMRLMPTTLKIRGPCGVLLPARSRFRDSAQSVGCIYYLLLLAHSEGKWFLCKVLNWKQTIHILVSICRTVHETSGLIAWEAEYYSQLLEL